MRQKLPKISEDERLANLAGDYYADPLGFVEIAFPWGEAGRLQQFTGPDKWQREFLIELGRQVENRNFDFRHAVAPVLMAVGSGRGVGKSALVAWLVCWLMTTRPHCKITVTANTHLQLQTKTWSAIKDWMALCITADWFVATSEVIFRIGHRDSWFAAAVTCKKENSQSFAGQHAAESSSVYIFDEASQIPDIIFEVAESGLTTGEPMMFLFGNVTQTAGQLYRALFGADRDKWIGRSVDTAESAIANKAKREEAVSQYGEDSDYVRVWHRGLAPRASDLQFIDSDRVLGAQMREVDVLPDEPLIAGLDCARGGIDNNVMRFRRGLDARSIPPIEIPGALTRDTMQFAAFVIEVLNRPFDGRKIDMLFVDSGYGGAIVNRCHQFNCKNVVEINFSNTPPDLHYHNMRAYMWGKMKEWLLIGAIDGRRENRRFTDALETDLTGPYFHHQKERLVLEAKESMKDRGLSSPGHGDALALTFAIPVSPKKQPKHGAAYRNRTLVRAWG